MRDDRSRRETPHPSSLREATLSHKGRGEATQLPDSVYGVMVIDEKSTNQLFGCTKPLIFGLMARGATSWAT
jgi:hypothetical protein